MSQAQTKRSLRRDVAERLGPEASAALTRTEWIDRLTSLWAPVVIFLCAFVPYIVWTQLRPQDAAFLQPVLKGFGLLMVVGLVLLAVLRASVPRFRGLRKARVESHEILQLLRRDWAITQVDAEKRERVLAQVVKLQQARIGTDPAAIEKEAERTAELVDKTLPEWKRHGTLENARGLIGTLVVVLLIRTIIAEPYRIPSGSMLPTLQIGDQVVVNRFLYGVRIPFINVVPFPIIRRPKKGDVIVFNNPLDESKDFIKRVVGVPGDTIELVESDVYVNGERQPRTVANRDLVVWDQDQVDSSWHSEHMTELEEDLAGVKHAVLQAPRPGHVREGPYTVPEGHVFVMGDNRDRSADSRYGFGVDPDNVAYVPYGHIKGKAMVVWLSLGHEGLFSNLFGGTGLRLDRLFLPIK